VPTSLADVRTKILWHVPENLMQMFDSICEVLYSLGVPLIEALFTVDKKIDSFHMD